MSLVLASSKQFENTTDIKSENPSSFTNFFRSPIEIEEDSEIAVQSVKLNRSGNVIVTDNDYLCHFFGEQMVEDDQEYRLGISRTIRPNAGNYTADGFARQLSKQFNTQYAHPLIHGNGSVILNTDAEGAEEGVKITFNQRTSGSGTDRSGSLTAVPFFNLQQNDGFGNGGRLVPSNDFTWTPGTGVFKRNGSNASWGLTDSGSGTPGGPIPELANASCIGILKDKPFSLNKGQCIFDSLSDANASGSYTCIGLTRPNVQFTGSASSATSIVEGPYMLGEDPNFLKEGATKEQVAGFSGMPDYAVLIPVGGSDLVRVVQTKFDEEDEYAVLEAITYFGLGGVVTSQMTKSAFYASYDGVIFEAFGDEIRLMFKHKGKTTSDLVLAGSLSLKPTECFAPIRDTNYALYPFINIGGGSVRLYTWSTNYMTPTPAYLFPSYSDTSKEYIPGSDMFSNESIPNVLLGGVARVAEGFQRDLARRTGLGLGIGGAIEIVDQSKTLWAGSTEDFEFVGLNAASDGVDYTHLLTLGKVDPTGDDFYLVASQEFPNMSRKLGYEGLNVLSEDSGKAYVTGAGTKAVSFTSPKEIKKSNISSFIRIPNLTHKSFNGAQQSLSKIVYQVPQFANDGSEFGPLYFEASEKTYVSLKNTAPMILNSLQVQFVDSEEKQLDSLNGVSQVVFHIRKIK
tara:strand:- start:11538 stop:13586 length:2049 start_codon:yes stop_codon:yes gene_type:complete